MNDYQPTDEQIESLAKHEFETSSRNEWSTAHDLEQRDFKDWARETAATPAFQAIIRAAQAEAWEQGQHDMARSFTRPLDDRGMRLAIPNPYRLEAADV